MESERDIIDDYHARLTEMTERWFTLHCAVRDAVFAPDEQNIRPALYAALEEDNRRWDAAIDAKNARNTRND